MNVKQRPEGMPTRGLLRTARARTCGRLLPLVRGTGEGIYSTLGER